jgi:diguanylate cyclase (GGDEF)-like protein
MKLAVPENESERIAALVKLNVLDTPLEERFERITRMVCRVLGVEISAVSLVDRDRQWFKSINGCYVTETARDVSFCTHAILNDEPFIVPDAAKDPRFADNPLVTGEPHIRFYAGIPISIEPGLFLGTLCAIDSNPRQISSEEIAILRDFARMVEAELSMTALSKEQAALIARLNQAERIARIDPLTRLWNRKGIDELIEREWNFASRKNNPLCFVMIDIDKFKPINDNYGHLVGDQVLQIVAQRLLTALRSYDAAGRWGGDEFILLLPSCDDKQVEAVLKRVHQEICSTPVQTAHGPISVNVSIGVACGIPRSIESAKRAIELADEKLLAAKRCRKGHVGIAIFP